jgi:hypothetical protein
MLSDIGVDGEIGILAGMNPVDVGKDKARELKIILRAKLLDKRVTSIRINSNRLFI